MTLPFEHPQPISPTHIPGTAPTVAADVLAHFYDFENLGEIECEILANRLQIKRAYDGSELFHFGDDDRAEMYLLSGQLKLIAEDGQERIIPANSDKSRQAIARLRPRQYTAKVVGTIEYLLLPLDVVKTIQSQQRAQAIQQDYTVAEIEVEGAQGSDLRGLLADIETDLVTQNIGLLIEPRVARVFQTKLAKQSLDIDLFVNFVYTDPALALFLIRFANSCIFGDAEKCVTVFEAVERLSLPIAKKIVLHALKRNRLERSEQLQTLHKDYWRQSQFVASIAFEIAQASGRVSLEQAMMLGLLSRIGSLMLLAYVDQHPQLLAQPQNIDQWLQSLNTDVAALLFKFWRLPLLFIDAANENENWLRQLGENITSDDEFEADALCDCLVVANALSLIGRRGKQAPPQINQLPAFQRLQLDRLAAADVARIVSGAKGRLKDLETELDFACQQAEKGGQIKAAKPTGT